VLPWSFSEDAAAEKYMAQLQHNMWVTQLRTSVLSIITSGGKWVEITIPMDPLYLAVLVSAEKKFWRCAQSGETPHLINAEPPRPRIEAIRIVDMSSSNSWAEFAALFCQVPPEKSLMRSRTRPFQNTVRRSWPPFKRIVHMQEQDKQRLAQIEQAVEEAKAEEARAFSRQEVAR
jgi:hypothetical protein